jgi:GNAT superfamily N-acetyltransferase
MSHHPLVEATATLPRRRDRGEQHPQWVESGRRLTAGNQTFHQSASKGTEAEARTRGCRQMWLDTYAFQARAFYERLGFSPFGQIDGPTPVFPRYFMQKQL